MSINYTPHKKNQSQYDFQAHSHLKNILDDMVDSYVQCFKLHISKL